MPPTPPTPPGRCFTTFTPSDGTRTFAASSAFPKSSSRTWETIAGPSEDRRRHCSTADPIGGLAGDQQAALFGQACLTRAWPNPPTGRDASSCSTRARQSSKPSAAHHARLPAEWPHDLRFRGFDLRRRRSIKWLRDGLGIIANAAETERLAQAGRRTITESIWSRRSSAWERRTGIRTRAARFWATFEATAPIWCARRWRRSPIRPRLARGDEGRRLRLTPRASRRWRDGGE